MTGVAARVMLPCSKASQQPLLTGKGKETNSSLQPLGGMRHLDFGPMTPTFGLLTSRSVR